MGLIRPGSEAAKSIDDAIRQWQQGDVSLAEHEFFYMADPRMALTDAAAQGEEEAALPIGIFVPGLAVISQTCDIVRSCVLRPFLEVAPLVEVSAMELAEARSARSTRYAFLPGLPSLMVVDLERTMTIEKSIACSWTRARGCRSDEEVRLLARALARKRQRFAFPDAFIDRMRPLQTRLRKKHDRNSAEGEALRALREIRIQAAPSWCHEHRQILVWFIRHDVPPANIAIDWPGHLQTWLALVNDANEHASIEGVVTSLRGMTADDYVNSDQLDFDYLSD